MSHFDFTMISLVILLALFWLCAVKAKQAFKERRAEYIAQAEENTRTTLALIKLKEWRRENGLLR